MKDFYRKRLAERRAILAPMAGFSDAPFRRLCREFGSAWAVTEMVSAKALVLGNQRGIDIGEPYPGEPDLVIQLFGSDPEITARAGVMLFEKYAPVALDLNMGCPVKKILNKGCGSQLMRDPELAAAIIQALVRAVPVPISAKMRLGFDHINVLEVAQAIEEAGASVIAIHGRTAAQKYTGAADWEPILEVKEAVNIPIIGSGDVATREAFERYWRYGLGVMIARGSIGRPWIFRELRGEGAPSVPDIVRLMLRHAALNCERYGEHKGMLSMRGQFARYALSLPRAEAHRKRLMRVTTLADLKVWSQEHFAELPSDIEVVAGLEQQPDARKLAQADKAA